MRFSRWITWLAFALATVAALTPAKAATPRTFAVREFGAIGDGRTLDTRALQAAIDRCAEAGGGTVQFAAGTYLSGTLVLRSDITLQLDAGATLRGSTNPKDYPHHVPAVRSYTDNYVRQALLYGENIERVTLRGAGTIDGNGAAFRWKEYVDRPFVIRLVKCRDVQVEGLTLRDSAMWMQHYLACDRVRIRGIRVFNHVSYNNDGLDLDSCHDVTVSDCVIDSDDDALCLKSTTGRACENVTVTNCVLSSHANAFKLGTESNGGFRNIAFSNSIILSPRFTKATYGIDRGAGGIALETVDGGHTENITINNIVLTGVNVPLFIRLGNRARPFLADGPKPPMGSMRNVSLSHIVATGTGRIGSSITGLPGSLVENVTLTNVSLETEGGGKRELAAKSVAEHPEAYPRVQMFGELPAYGLYVRHVRGVQVRDLRLATTAADARHALIGDDVHDVGVDGLSVPVAPGAVEPLFFRDVTRAMITRSRVRDAADVLLRLDGSTRGIVLAGNDFSNVQRPVVSEASVSPGAWTEIGNTAPAKQ